MQINQTDKKILNSLIKNSKASFRDIAKDAKCSAVTVMKKIHMMQKCGLIKKYSVVLDYEKIGFDVTVIIDVRVSKGKLFLVEKKIATHPNVMSVYDNTGEYDVSVIAKFKSRASMDLFLKNLQSYEFVERTQTKLVLNTIKEENIEV
jgi:DNA-binding Lrp family transcriptional regulator